jgi:DNA repair exonuclease SbcCD ATPase subunit
MFIDFKEATAKNFMSIGNNPITIDLKEFTKTLVVGKNGVGKSVIIEIIIFALYGKPYRKINKPALVNSINGKQCEVEVKFEINGDNYQVIRGIKPDVFKIFKNDVLVEEDAASKDYQAYLEKTILKMDYKTCCQMVIVGAMNYVPFLQLKAADRRVFIETVLDLQLFADLNKNLKLIQSDVKTKFTQSQTKLNILTNKIATFDSVIKDLESNKDKKKEALDVIIKAKMTEYKSSTSLSESFQKELSEIIFEDNSVELQQIINDATAKISVAQTTISKLSTKIKFFDTTAECQTCEQSIDPTHKQKHIDSMQTEIDANNKLMADYQTRKNEAQFKLNELQILKQKKQDIERKLKNNQDSAEYVKKEIVRLGKEKQGLDTTDDGTLSNTKVQLQQASKEYQDEELILNQFDIKSKVYTKMLEDLKDTGAKAEIIKNYIPTINNSVNSYLDKFNLFVKFELDGNFNETLKSRQRDLFSYESFSNGERARIDMSMLFTWREITKVRTGIDTNLFFVDEILEIGDMELFDELLSIVESKGKMNCFIISHKDNLEVKFDNVIHLIKQQGFTIIQDKLA